MKKMATTKTKTTSTSTSATVSTRVGRTCFSFYSFAVFISLFAFCFFGPCCLAAEVCSLPSRSKATFVRSLDGQPVRGQVATGQVIILECRQMAAPKLVGNPQAKCLPNGKFSVEFGQCRSDSFETSRERMPQVSPQVQVLLNFHHLFVCLIVFIFFCFRIARFQR